jgi:hypothetical protein
VGCWHAICCDPAVPDHWTDAFLCLQRSCS